MKRAGYTYLPAAITITTRIIAFIAAAAIATSAAIICISAR